MKSFPVGPIQVWSLNDVTSTTSVSPSQWPTEAPIYEGSISSGCCVQRNHPELVEDLIEHDDLGRRLDDLHRKQANRLVLRGMPSIRQRAAGSSMPRRSNDSCPWPWPSPGKARAGGRVASLLARSVQRPPGNWPLPRFPADCCRRQIPGQVGAPSAVRGIGGVGRGAGACAYAHAASNNVIRTGFMKSLIERLIERQRRHCRHRLFPLAARRTTSCRP